MSSTLKERLLKKGKGHARLLGFYGNLLIVLGALAMAADFISRYWFSFPFNMGIVTGNAAIAAAGLIGVTASNSLRSLEDRLRRVEELEERSQNLPPAHGN